MRPAATIGSPVADDQKPGERAVLACEIDDVFLVSVECKVSRDFNQSAIGLEDGAALQRVMIDNSVLMQSRTLAGPKEGQVHILRYFVRGEVNFPMPGKALDEKNLIASDILATLVHEYAIDYRCSMEFFNDKAAVSAFAKNALFHSWSFWREAVIADCGRFRLPRIVIPMMKIRSPFTASADFSLLEEQGKLAAPK
jgi:hypothetical protein